MAGTGMPWEEPSQVVTSRHAKRILDSQKENEAKKAKWLEKLTEPPVIEIKLPSKQKQRRKKRREEWKQKKNSAPVITSFPKRFIGQTEQNFPRYANNYLRTIIYKRDAGQCQYCGKEVSYKDCNIDHVIPWPEGKTNENNLVVACKPCNKLKGKQIIPSNLRPILP